jgi:hypothetical protein
MVAPGGEDGFFEDALVGFGEEDIGAAFAAPGSLAWIENGGMGVNEIFLLDGREFDHSELFVRIGEGGEDFSRDAEVGVVHVLALFALRQAEGDAAEVGGSGRHDTLLQIAIRTQIGRRSLNAKKKKKLNAEAQSSQRKDERECRQTEKRQPLHKPERRSNAEH